MKYLFVSILFFSFIGTHAQEQNKITIRLVPHDCRGTNDVYFNLYDTICFYRDSKLFKAVKVNGFDPSFKVEDFEAGNYRVTYKNIFNQKISRNITIPNSANYKVNLCLNELDKPNEESIFDKLKDGENAYFIYFSTGCFSSQTDTLIITKKKTAFIASYKKRKLVLSAKQIREVKNFESILESVIFRGGCTAIDMYTIDCKYKKIKVSDNTCSWNGFILLKSALFKEAE